MMDRSATGAREAFRSPMADSGTESVESDTTTPSGEVLGLLDDVLRKGLIECVYQPVVDLLHGEVVGYEALARGPVGSPLASPAALFATAAAAGRLAELDHACRVAALRGALDGGLTMRHTLFVNVEPAFLGMRVPDELADLERQAEQRLRLVFEFSEQGLVDHPAELLATVQGIRERSWGLSMDDVGVHPASSSLLPLVRPDVLKVNRGVLSGEKGPIARGRLLNAVTAAAETTGASVLVQGIETEDDVLEARGLGILLGQGFHLGRPAPLEVAGPLPRAAVPLLRATHAPSVDSPFRLARAAGVQVRRASRSALAAISHDLEVLASSINIAPVVLALFQHADNFTPSVAWRYRELAQSAAVVGVAGVVMEPEPTHGVRGVAIPVGDVLADEWAVVVVSPYVNAALLAREVREDGGPDVGRRFDFVLTHDESLVVDAAEVLLRRVRSVGTAPPVQADGST